MPTRNLLYKGSIQINDKIEIIIPSVGEVLEDEDNYYDLVSSLTAMPIDMMVQLDDAGVDFSTIDEYQLFLMLFIGMRERDTSLIFGNLDLKNFTFDEDNGSMILKDEKNDIVIDKLIHTHIAGNLRKIHHLEKNRRKPANDEARDYMLQREREKRKRKNKRVRDSELESLIVAMVNTEQYKYDFERTRELSIYQFNESVRQIIKKVDYTNKMYGVYTGTINAKELSRDDLNWLIHK